MSKAGALAQEAPMVVVAMVQAVALPGAVAATVVHPAVPAVVPLVAITVVVVVRRDPIAVIEVEVVVSEARKALVAVAQIVAGVVLAVAMQVAEETIPKVHLPKIHLPRIVRYLNPRLLAHPNRQLH